MTCLDHFLIKMRCLVTLTGGEQMNDISLASACYTPQEEEEEVSYPRHLHPRQSRWTTFFDRAIINVREGGAKLTSRSHLIVIIRILRRVASIWQQRLWNQLKLRSQRTVKFNLEPIEKYRVSALRSSDDLLLENSSALTKVGTNPFREPVDTLFLSTASL